MTVSTQGYGGHQLRKKIEVFTNEPKPAKHRLHIGGKVEQFVQINPRMARLNGSVTQPIQSEVVITPRDAYPFEITAVTATQGKDIRYSLEPQTRDGKSVYLLQIENTRNQPGNIRDTIKIATNHPINKEIRVQVRGDIRK